MFVPLSFLFISLTGSTGLSGLFFILSHFPDGSEKTQSASSGKLIFLVSTMYPGIILYCPLITLKPMSMFTLAGGDWVFSVSSGN
jgi:hypothetical protein